ncbi:hypothetical protein C8J34_110102 [Rhizobium sp. PP-F2F-G36]|nr:hypothetical protein C8J34_110102 [Rhizobium sp. PP-F2F-G36]
MNYKAIGWNVLDAIGRLIVAAICGAFAAWVVVMAMLASLAIVNREMYVLNTIVLYVGMPLLFLAVWLGTYVGILTVLRVTVRRLTVLSPSICAGKFRSKR